MAFMCLPSVIAIFGTARATLERDPSMFLILIVAAKEKLISEFFLSF